LPTLNPISLVTGIDLALLLLAAIMVLMIMIAVVPVGTALAAVKVTETEALLAAATMMTIDVVIDHLPEPVVLLMTTHHHVAGLMIHIAVIIPQILTLQTDPVMIEDLLLAITHQETILPVVMTDAPLTDYDYGYNAVPLL